MRCSRIADLLRAEPREHAVQPQIVDRSVWRRVAHKLLEVRVFAAQVGSSCTSVIASSGGRPLGSTRVRMRERRRAPLAQRLDMRACLSRQARRR